MRHHLKPNIFPSGPPSVDLYIVFRNKHRDNQKKFVPHSRNKLGRKKSVWGIFFLLFHSRDLGVNSSLSLLLISSLVTYQNLVLDQDNKLYLTSLSILITCLLNNVWILWGDVTC